MNTRIILAVANDRKVHDQWVAPKTRYQIQAFPQPWAGAPAPRLGSPRCSASPRERVSAQRATGRKLAQQINAPLDDFARQRDEPTLTRIGCEDIGLALDVPPR